MLTFSLLHRAGLALALSSFVASGCGSSPSAAPGGELVGGPDSGSDVADAADAGADAPPPSSPYAPKGVTIGGHRVNEVRFLDPQNGFLLLAGDTPGTRGVWATVDGGESWAQREIDIVPSGIAFTHDVARLWVVGSTSVSNLWSTADRGKTFAPLTWTAGTPGRIAFVDASTILVPDYRGNALYRSTDGGASWTTKDFDGTFAALRIAVQGSDVWLAGGRNRASGAQVTHSADAGATWSITTLTDKAHTFEGGQLGAISRVSKTEVWVAGENRQLFHTTDGGQTWPQITGIPASLDTFGGIDVQGARITIAGSSTIGYALYVSDDGGAHFHVAEEIRCPSRCGRVMGIESPTPNVLFVYGDGLLWRVQR